MSLCCLVACPTLPLVMYGIYRRAEGEGERTNSRTVHDRSENWAKLYGFRASLFRRALEPELVRTSFLFMSPENRIPWCKR